MLKLIMVVVLIVVAMFRMIHVFLFDRLVLNFGIMQVMCEYQEERQAMLIKNQKYCICRNEGGLCEEIRPSWSFFLCPLPPLDDGTPCAVAPLGSLSGFVLGKILMLF